VVPINPRFRFRVNSIAAVDACMPVPTTSGE